MSRFNTMEDYQNMLETAKTWYVRAIIWASSEFIRIIRMAEGHTLCDAEQITADFVRRLVLGQVIMTKEHLKGMNSERLDLVEYVRHAEITLGNGTYSIPDHQDPGLFVDEVFDLKWEQARRQRSEGRRPLPATPPERPRPLPTPE